MLRKDYIMRMLEQFFKVLAKLIKNENNLEIEDIEIQLAELYDTYFKNDFNFFHDSDTDRIIEFLKSDNSGDDLYKVEMLAELIYQDACLQQENEQRKSLLIKSLNLLEYLDKESKTFSMERFNKMEFIKNEVSLLG